VALHLWSFSMGQSLFQTGLAPRGNVNGRTLFEARYQGPLGGGRSHELNIPMFEARSNIEVCVEYSAPASIPLLPFEFNNRRKVNSHSAAKQRSTEDHPSYYPSHDEHSGLWEGLWSSPSC
ncbi:hypothetical protein, partial [Pelagibacterium lacus]|uniref:hypothetical protein n=1 Tax=Pelagibacterium lacus TaxID=2282655 RepID=UPI001AEC8A93